MNVRWRCAGLAAQLPFWFLGWLTRHAPVWCSEDCWPIWLDAHYYRYCRFDMALWGWCGL